MKKCPFCNEEILDEAIKCRFCGEFINKKVDNDTPPIAAIPSTANRRKSSWLPKILLFILLAILLSGMASQGTNKRNFPILNFVLVLVSISGIIIAIRSAQEKKERSKLFFAICIPLFILSILFFLSDYNMYKKNRAEDKILLDMQNASNVQKEKYRQDALEHIEENYQKSLLLIKENKYSEAKPLLKKVLETDSSYKEAKKLFEDVDNKIIGIENENKKKNATIGINEAEKLSASKNCYDIDQAIRNCESALLVFPDSSRAKNILLKAKIAKLLCFEGNGEIQMAIDIVKYNPVTLFVTIKNISKEVRHANPNFFTLITVTGNSYSYSSETYGSGYTAFDAVELQPGTKISGAIVFDTNAKPKELVYSEMIGTRISRVFPF